MVLGYLHFRKPTCLSATAGQTFVLLDGCQVTSTRNGPRLRSGEFKRLGKWKMSMPSANWGLVGFQGFPFFFRVFRIFPDGWPGFEMNQQAGVWWSENHRKPWTIMNNNDHEIPTTSGSNHWSIGVGSDQLDVSRFSQGPNLTKCWQFSATCLIRHISFVRQVKHNCLPVIKHGNGKSSTNRHLRC